VRWRCAGGALAGATAVVDGAIMESALVAGSAMA